MADWKIKEKYSGGMETVADILTGGLFRSTVNPDEYYVVENEESGDTRVVMASDEEEVGEKIRLGLFYK